MGREEETENVKSCSSFEWNFNIWLAETKTSNANDCLTKWKRAVVFKYERTVQWTAACLERDHAKTSDQVIASSSYLKSEIECFLESCRTLITDPVNNLTCDKSTKIRLCSLNDITSNLRLLRTYVLTSIYLLAIRLHARIATYLTSNPLKAIWTRTFLPSWINTG